MKPIIGLVKEKITAAKSMGSKMTKVLEKNKTGEFSKNWS